MRTNDSSLSHTAERRNFLRSAINASLALALISRAPRTSAAPVSVKIARSNLGIPAGADCTDLLQNAIDHLPTNGGEIVVGPGDYMVDTTRSIRLRTGVTLTLEDGATLRALPTERGSYAIIRIANARNVAIKGGTILGERGQHRGTTGEWGMGVDIRGSHDVTLDGLRVEACWGDGVYVGTTNEQDSGGCSGVTLVNVVAQGNRRQGLSIVACKGAVIRNCTFSNTQGTAPAAGIDLEPNANLSVSDIQIIDCTAENNQGDGIQIYAGAEGATVTRCSIKGGTLKGNRRYGASIVGGTNCDIDGTAILGSADFAVWIGMTSSDCIVAPAMLAENGLSPRSRMRAMKGALGLREDDISVDQGALRVTVRHPAVASNKSTGSEK